MPANVAADGARLRGSSAKRKCWRRSPTIDAYKSGIDRTLLRDNLRLTPAERVDRMVAALRFAEAVRASRTTAAG